MNAWKYEIISHIEQDISLVRFAHLWDILVNTRNKFHISAHPCIILYLICWSQHSQEKPVAATRLGRFVNPHLVINKQSLQLFIYTRVLFKDYQAVKFEIIDKNIL